MKNHVFVKVISCFIFIQSFSDHPFSIFYRNELSNGEARLASETVRSSTLLNVCILLLSLTAIDRETRLFRRYSVEIYRMKGLLIFQRIGKVWRNERRQPKNPGVDLDNFPGELLAEYVRWNRVKNSCGPFSARNKGEA